MMTSLVSQQILRNIKHAYFIIIIMIIILIG